MDIFTGSPSVSLRQIANRTAIDRMELAYKHAAQDEMARRAALSPEQLRRQLAKAERHHRRRYDRTGDDNHLRWADELKSELGS